MVRKSYLYALALFMSAAGFAPMVQAAAVITGIKTEMLSNGAERVSFLTKQAITPGKYLVLANPDRIAINLPSAHAPGLRLPAHYKGKLLKSIRFGQFDPTTSRIVVDLNQPATVRSLTAGAPLVLELVPGKMAEAGSATQPAPPAEKKKPLIAIDAGHGGQDPGATGIHATHERDVTLNFAQTLGRALIKTGRYNVTFTRDDDTYVLLPERVNIARKAKADLFVSLHADSNPRPEARGLSIYTLSATASDDEAAALAERENKSDIITGIDLNTTDADVANILIDLTQRETMNKSTSLADDIVMSLDRKINRLPSTHRFAGFRVLKAPDVPSVLIELGFLSNATDERLLLSPDYRDLVVASIIKGIDRYYAMQ